MKEKSCKSDAPESVEGRVTIWRKMRPVTATIGRTEKYVPIFLGMQEKIPGSTVFLCTFYFSM